MSRKKSRASKKARGMFLALVFLFCLVPLSAGAEDTSSDPWAALERVERADAETRRVAEEMEKNPGAANRSGIAAANYGCTMVKYDVNGSERYETEWSNVTMAAIKHVSFGSHLGYLGGNFVHKSWPWTGGLVRARTEGSTAYGNESFISSGGTLVWSGGPYVMPIVHTDYITLVDYSATFRGAIWYVY